jgi:hypothetical protein
MAAGLFHIMENDVRQALFLDCLYSNEKTFWKPSCNENSLNNNPGLNAIKKVPV